MRYVCSVVIFCLSATMVQAATGLAELHGTAEGSKIAGSVAFVDTPKGLEVTLKAAGLPPGKHGFHIHEFGSCADMGKAAGSHFNPMNAPHGMVTKDGLNKAHAGDLGNIDADTQGEAALHATIPNVSLGVGLRTVGGRAVIVHEKADDFGQPVGNAGGRIACGIIHITGN